MTDRLSGFVVVLEEDTRDDDAQATLDAIRQLRGVLSVEPHIRDVGELISRSRIKREIMTNLLAMARDA